MAHGTPRWMVLLLAGLLVAWLGCRQEPPPEEKPGLPEPPAVAEEEVEDEGPAEVPVAKPEPPPPPKIPEVLLPEQLAKTCLVAVGDPMPEGELTTLEGTPQALAPLYGEKLTVVFFWKGEDLYSQMAAVDAMQFLEADVAKAYGDKGVQVVAINVGQTAEAVRQRVDEAKPSYPVLLDPEGAYFAKVATEQLPRIYLLDAEGKILWFDVEYSRTTRNYLMQAIQAALGEPPPAAP